MDETPRESVMAWQFLRRHFVRITAIACLLVALFGAVLVVMQYQREKRIAGEIESHGGRVEFVYGGPNWIPQSVSDRLPFLDRIDAVYLDYLLEEAASMELLSELELLTNLTFLKLEDTPVTNAGLERLTGLTNLDNLILNNTQVTDDGLEHLKGLTNLINLSLDNTQVTGAGLEYLKGLTNLQNLHLNNTQVTDAGLEHLKGLTDLKRLQLDNTQVTDAGLEHLKGLTNLKWFDLVNTQVTAEGRATLRKALPNCKIEPNP